MQRNIAADPTCQFLILKCVIVIFDLRKLCSVDPKKKKLSSVPFIYQGRKSTLGMVLNLNISFM